MRPRLIQTDRGQFEIAEWTGSNTSGHVPFGDRVLILPDQAKEKTSGAIVLPEDIRERIAEAAETGVLVALGEAAFKWTSDRMRPYEGIVPQPGQHVFFERYSGAKLWGVDGRVYRVMDDKCIGALLAEQAPEKQDESAAPSTKRSKD